jgi:hypothetical protein
MGFGYYLFLDNRKIFRGGGGGGGRMIKSGRSATK